MKRVILACALGLAAFVSEAQEMNASTDFLADMFKRQLKVEFADSAVSNKNKITAYPQKTLGFLIKAAAEEVWKVNAKMEFVTQEDLKKNLEKGEARAAYLYLSLHPDSKPDKMIWILNYTSGPAFKEGKPDYQIYLPDISLRNVKEFNQVDIEFTMSLMQEHMKHMQKSGKKITPAEYMYVEAEKNCKTMKTAPVNVLLDQGYVSTELDDKGIKRAFKKVNTSLLTAEQINSVLIENKDTTAIIILYPARFETLSTSAMGEKYVFWNKAIVHTGNYKVLGVVGSGRKDNVLIEIVGDDITSMLKCE